MSTYKALRLVGYVLLGFVIGAVFYAGAMSEFFVRRDFPAPEMPPMALNGRTAWIMGLWFFAALTLLAFGRRGR